MCNRNLWRDCNLLVFEKFTRAYLFQIALEIMWLPIQTRNSFTIEYISPSARGVLRETNETCLILICASL